MNDVDEWIPRACGSSLLTNEHSKPPWPDPHTAGPHLVDRRDGSEAVGGGGTPRLCKSSTYANKILARSSGAQSSIR